MKKKVSIFFMLACMGAHVFAQTSSGRVTILKGEEVLAQTQFLASATNNSSWRVSKTNILNGDRICPKEQMWTGAKAIGVSELQGNGIRVTIEDFEIRLPAPEKQVESIPCPSFNNARIQGHSVVVAKGVPLIYELRTSGQVFKIQIELD